ncbi:MAG TPA: cbb3-type cytochrome c oxidase N-terminal domain-containing protein [Sphingobacterium sp.]|nr:cbb3-type cytochrome c oxidase N-terminal domain-containing protein [Sphingobacterium sp.]
MNLFLLVAEPAASLASNWLDGSGNIYIDILVMTLVVLMVALLFFAIVIQKALRSILKITMPEVMQQETEKAQVRRVEQKVKWKKTWNNLLGLRPMEEEKDIMIDHEYDGIVELDNPIPLWFNVLFYSTVIFGVAYLLVYHVFGWGMNQDQEYLHELAQADKAKEEFLAQSANLIDESSVEFDASMAVAGKAIYMTNCAACHGGAGEGTIGPNLTDRFWIHGGEIKDIFKTVKYGVPEKGMVPWEQTLTPAQIAEVSSYIITLRDSNPPNPKQAEGDEVTYGAASGGDDAEVVADGNAEESADSEE